MAPSVLTGAIFYPVNQPPFPNQDININGNISQRLGGGQSLIVRIEVSRTVVAEKKVVPAASLKWSWNYTGKTGGDHTIKLVLVTGSGRRTLATSRYTMALPPPPIALTGTIYYPDGGAPIPNGHIGINGGVSKPPAAGQSLAVRVVPPNDPAVDHPVTPNGNGAWSCTYTGSTSGAHTVRLILVENGTESELDTSSYVMLP